MREAPEFETVSKAAAREAVIKHEHAPQLA